MITTRSGNHRPSVPLCPGDGHAGTAKRLPWWQNLLLIVPGLLLGLVAQAQVPEHTLCVFDVAGSQGEITGMMKNYALQALSAGVALRMRSLSDEDEVIRLFKAGECQLAAISDVRAREFNFFAGSISAIGAMPDYGDMHILMAALADPRMARRLDGPEYQVLGFLPLGAVFLFVNDRGIDTAEELAGKRMAVLDHHPDAAYMVRHVKAIPVTANMKSFAQLFNRGEVDVVYAPAAAYEYLELERGMGPNGGVIRYPVGHFTLQLIARTGEFDGPFAQRSRRILADLYPRAMQTALRYEEAIPAARWVELPQSAIDGYQEMIRQVRMSFVNGASGGDLSSLYDPDMLRLMRKIRCHNDLGASECRSGSKE